MVLSGGLAPSAASTKVRLARNQVTATDGPFTETKEVIGGFFMVEVKDKREAIAIAKRCPHIKGGFVEVRRVIPVGGGS